MKIPSQSSTLMSLAGRSIPLIKRQNGSISGNMLGLIIFAVIVGFLLCGGLILLFLLRHLRARHANPKYLPGTWLKTKWRAWMPSSAKKRYSSSLQDRRSTPSASVVGFAALNNDQTPDRNTSVRSTITLPAYTASVRPTERVLGREGERAGMDQVLEYPEDAADEEQRRDDEMEGLYQIRLARHNERDEREERRQARREARARNDIAELERLRLATITNDLNTSDFLIEQHNILKGRGRKVSTVNYLDLGVARHDGSRVRADSAASSRSLLGDAASMAGSEGRPRLGANLGNESTLSLRQLMADASDDEGASDVESETPRLHLSPAISRTRLVVDTGVSQDIMPPHYDEVSSQGSRAPLPRLPEPVAVTELGGPPEYQSPLRTGAPVLPLIVSVPAIEITPTPWSPVHS